MIRKITDNFSPKHYLVEFLLFLTAVFGFYLIIAWSSYSPFDSAWSVSSYQSTVINKAGWIGAWLTDIFLNLFGYVGHLLPFLAFIAPIYFIKTKRADRLTWKRFGLRMFGFALLMLGLTTLSTLALNNSDYYLSGGVIGAVLAKFMQPTIGQFGLLMFGVAFSSLGFVFCSGASLIRLLVRFYHWLTVKDDNLQDSSQKQFKSDGNEEGEIFTQNLYQGEQQELPFEQKTEELTPKFAKELIKEADIEAESKESQQKIQISGLPEKEWHNEEQIDINAPQFNDFEIEKPILPEVSITIPDEAIQIANQGVVPSWEHSKKVENETLTPDFLMQNTPKAILPQDGEVSDNFAHSAANLSIYLPNIVSEREEKNFDDDFSKLAEQFAERENLREETRQQQIAALGEQQENTLPSEDAAQNEPQMKNGLRTIPIDQLVDLFGEHKAQSKPKTDFPTLDLLDKMQVQAQNISQEQINETSRRIEQQLQNFKIKATVKGVLIGPVVTRYELELQPGVKASAVSRIDTDLARALTFKSIRVTETIPDKPYIGIETPNKTRQIVPLRDVLDSDAFRHSKALLPMALGKDISGNPIVIDLAKTPHLLVAGSTGSGKSVGINTMILSLLFKVKPEEVKFIMIDPKVVELSVYNDIPHLLTEVVTDMKKAANALRWCVDEMERRYQLLSLLRVRNIEGYNEKIEEYRKQGIGIPDPLWKPGDSLDTSPPLLDRMSYIVVIVDEFADLMMQVGKQIEELIARLTQKARAVGIHVILATQRPSVDVITGLIKSNIPSRIAFTVVQRNDSRTILDQNGAEALLGRGDMLYLANGTTELIRVHGAFMSDDEVNRVADDWRARGKPNYISSILESADDNEVGDDNDDFGSSSDELDPLFDKAVEVVVNTGMTSTSFIQRRLKIGFNRAANIMDQLEEQGIVSEMRNGKRELLARSPDF